MNCSVTATNFLQIDGKPVRRDIITGGKAMPVRRALVLHFTGGATGKSSIAAMRERGVSAHLVIDRDGSVTQCRAFDLTAGHAGVSRWVDPVTSRKYTDCNDFTIGIEIANAGDDAGAQAWARKQGSEFAKAKHRNGGPEVLWEEYTDAQIASVTAVCQALVLHFHLDDITGHDCIAPERKNDPGPLFPMASVRKACGFSGLPIVYRA